MRSSCLWLAASLLVPSATFAGATGDDDPKNVIAAQIREQGFQCDSPQSATQDMQASKPDEAVWVLQCETTRYRVRLVPDMAAKVERLDGKEDNDR